MNSRLILHIGAPKCGSTYLQRVLLKNQQTLRNAAVHYPHTGVGHPGNGSRIDEISASWINAALEKCDTIILSHEDLFGISPKGLRLRHLAQKMGFQFQIIAFFREFAEVLFADFSQTLRQNFSKFCAQSRAFNGQSFFEFCQNRHSKIAPEIFLRDWQAHSPETPIILRHHQDIRVTLEKLLPQSRTLDWSIPRWRSNPSLPMQTCLEICSAIDAGQTERAQNLLRNPTTDENPDDMAIYRDFVQNLFQDRRAALLEDFGFAA